MKKTLILLLAVISLATGCRDVSGALKLYGYRELTLPSTWMVPGTVVFLPPVGRLGSTDADFKAGIVCTAAQNLGHDFQPYESETIAQQIKTEKDFSMNLDVEIGEMASVHSKFGYIDHVTVHLKNVHLFELSDWHVAMYAGQRDAACNRAIQARIKAGYHVTMISSALQADAEYVVDFRKDVSLTANNKLQAVRAVAKGFGISASKVTTGGFSANKLIWGVKGDDFLLLASMIPSSAK